MVNWVKAKTKFADGSLSDSSRYLFVEHDDRYGLIYRNVSGGFCLECCIKILESGIYTGSKKQFIELHRKEFYSHLIKKESAYGWLSPFCEWYPCDYLHHQDIAEDYLGYSGEELEERGWIKVFKEYDSDNAVYATPHANSKQLEWLYNHQVNYSKFACMQ